MTPGSPQAVLLVLGAITALFAVVICVSLVFRKKIQCQTQEIKAMDLWKDSFNPPSKPSDLLVGLLSDDGWWAMSLLIKNSRDEVQAKATYQLKHKISIEAGGQRYEAIVSTETMLYKVVSSDASEPSCSYKGGLLRTSISRYDVPQIGMIEVEGDFEIKVNNQSAGRIFPLSKIVQRGAVLLLPDDLPIHIRAFILAMEYRRLT